MGWGCFLGQGRDVKKLYKPCAVGALDYSNLEKMFHEHLINLLGIVLTYVWLKFK